MKSALTAFTKNMEVKRTQMIYSNQTLNMHITLVDIESLLCSKQRNCISFLKIIKKKKQLSFKKKRNW